MCCLPKFGLTFISGFRGGCGGTDTSTNDLIGIKCGVTVVCGELLNLAYTSGGLNDPHQNRFRFGNIHENYEMGKK